LEGVLARSQRAEPSLREKIVNSVVAAMRWSRHVEPGMCSHYIDLWQNDLITWKRRLIDAPTLLSTTAALRELDLALSRPSLDAPSRIMVRNSRPRDGWPIWDGIRLGSGPAGRTKISKERFGSAAAYWNPDHRPLIAGRHRGAPKPALAVLSGKTEVALRQQTFLTELSMSSPAH